MKAVTVQVRLGVTANGAAAATPETLMVAACAAVVTALTVGADALAGVTVLQVTGVAVDDA